MSLTDRLKGAIPRPLKRELVRLRFDYRNRHFKPYVTTLVVEGERFDFFIGDPEGQDWYAPRSTDPRWPEMRFMRDHVVTRGDVVLECGAHHGCTAILLSRWVGSTGRVVCFEPMPANCAIITRNVALNDLRNVTLVQEAVGREQGFVRIDATSNAAVQNSSRGIQVPQTFIDAYEGLRPTVLKIDVEGFEHHVLMGGRRVLETKPKIALELHPDHVSMYGGSVEDILVALRPLGYRMWLQEDDAADPVEFDGRRPITRRAHLFCV